MLDWGTEGMVNPFQEIYNVSNPTVTKFRIEI